jgi:hypothetical protein
MPEYKRHDVFISYSSSDKLIVNQVIEAMRVAGLKPYYAEVDLRAGEYINEGVTDGLLSSKGAVFFVSPAAAKSGWVKHEVQMAHESFANNQIKFIIFVLLRRIDEQELSRMTLGRKHLDFSGRELIVKEVLDDLSEQLIETIRRHIPVAGENVVDIPFVIIAMKAHEARGLLVDGSVSPVNPITFEKLMKELTDKTFTPERLANFYGEGRDDWRSPLCQAHGQEKCERAEEPEGGDEGQQPEAGEEAWQAEAGGHEEGRHAEGGHAKAGRMVTIREFIKKVVQRINSAAGERGSDLIIDPQFKSEDFTSADADVRIRMHRELEDRCVLVVDSLSLFHPELSRFLDRSPLAHRAKNVIPIAVPPPYCRPPESIDEIIEGAMKDMMTLPFDRFENGDALCEFSISHPRALKRWLFAALPEAARKFSRPLPRDDNRVNFQRGNFS